MQISGAVSISRRYFVMNSFDGAMTALGIIMGATASRMVNPRLILGAGLGASVAMAISGFCGAYMTERAERERTLRHLSRAMLHNLDRSIHARAMRVAIFWTALIDAASPTFAACLSMLPFLLAVYRIVDATTAVIASVSIVLVMLFLLGIYLGKICRENLVMSGIRTVGAGVLTLIVSLLLGLF